MILWGWRGCVSRAAPILLLFSGSAAGMGDPRDLYCGKDNCYELLDLTRDASDKDVKKAYRKMAMKWHPDKNRGKAKEAEKMFKKIARANEVLTDTNIREAYDYFLDHPDDKYVNYYQYYRASFQPKTPVWMVFTGFFSFLSALQYLNQHWMYSRMKKAVKYQQSFQRRVKEILEEKAKTMKLTRRERESPTLREQVENDIFENEVQLSGNNGKKPSVMSLVGVRVCLLPITMSKGIADWFMWHWKFNVKGQEYGAPEMEYLTRCALSMPEQYWLHLDEERRTELVERALWRKENLEKYRQEQEAEQKEKMRESGAYKRYKRFMKNH